MEMHSEKVMPFILSIDIITYHRHKENHSMIFYLDSKQKQKYVIINLIFIYYDDCCRISREMTRICIYTSRTT